MVHFHGLGQLTLKSVSDDFTREGGKQVIHHMKKYEMAENSSKEECGYVGVYCEFIPNSLTAGLSG